MGYSSRPKRLRVYLDILEVLNPLEEIVLGCDRFVIELIALGDKGIDQSSEDVSPFGFVFPPANGPNLEADFIKGLNLDKTEEDHHLLGGS